MSELACIVLAAGKGTRMKSEHPKVLTPILGAPLIQYPVHLARSLKCDPLVVVVGHEKDRVVETVTGIDGAVRFAHQKEQLGTADAVRVGMSRLKGHKGPVLVLSGDVPLLQPATVRRMIKAFAADNHVMALVAFEPDDPAGYGRVIVERGGAAGIVEHKDATAAERKIRLANAGIYVFSSRFLRAALKRITAENAQGEFYLTDLVAMANEATDRAVPYVVAASEEVMGVNDRADQWRVEDALRRRIIASHMKKGVVFSFPDTVLVEPTVRIGAGTVVGAGVHLRGATRIGRDCRIEPGVLVADTVVEDGVHLYAYSVLESSVVRAGAHVGPMGRLRPGSDVGPGAKVGNFVELKNTVLGPGSKANHLSYLGDGTVGARVNLGAGCIFCNYDGFLKHRTVIDDDVFVGSDSQIVAPVHIARGAYVASGTTVTQDVPEDALAISRGRQINKPRFAARLRKRLAERKRALAKKKGKKARGR